jgi:hypothetical protein
MNFTTIAQYFYKLYSNVLVLLLVSILIFIASYLSVGVATKTFDLSTNSFYATAVIVSLLWISVFAIFSKKIKSIPNDQGLRVKLEKYFTLTIVRYSLLSVGFVILAVAFFVSKENTVTLFFVIHLLLCGALWPRPSKVCGDLKLRGDEREMVYYKKDSF